MPRRRKNEAPTTRSAARFRFEGKDDGHASWPQICAKLRGIGFVYVGSLGQEPNWFARPIPSRLSDACRREFVTALAAVRKEFDLMPSEQDQELVAA